MSARIVCVAAALAAVGSVAGAAIDFEVREASTITRTLRFGGPGEHVLDVRNLNGSIRVTSAGAGDSVQLDARRTIEAVSAEEVRRADVESVLSFIDGMPKIEVVVQEPQSPICGVPQDGQSWQRRPRYRVTYEMRLSVPSPTRLRLCTLNGREIEVSGTTGDFDLENVNGRITIDGVRGSGSARTVNGAVTATLLELPRGNVEFSTTNGDVTVTWPAGLEARLRMKTFNGGLFTDFPAVPVDVTPSPAAQRRDGRFVYRSNQYTEVQVGRGGPEVTLASFNGDVRVLRAGR